MIKRYLAEFVGTFVIVFAPVAVSAIGHVSGVDQGLLVAAIASGLPVLAMIAALGPISAAHFNPAVTLGFALAKRFPWRYVAPYWLVQMAGGVVAAAVVALLYGGGSGVHIPADTHLVLRNVGTEVAITFILMLVIIATATDKRMNPIAPPLAIGLTVIFGVLIGGPITGGSMNPARSFGPALFGNPEALGAYWVYIVGPMLGASIAALAFEAMRSNPENACSAPGDLV